MRRRSVLNKRTFHETYYLGSLMKLLRFFYLVLDYQSLKVFANKTVDSKSGWVRALVRC